MSVVWIALPVTLLLATGFVVAFIWCARKGQYEDTETPPIRMLYDDDPVEVRKEEKDHEERSS